MVPSVSRAACDCSDPSKPRSAPACVGSIARISRYAARALSGAEPPATSNRACSKRRAARSRSPTTARSSDSTSASAGATGLTGVSRRAPAMGASAVGELACAARYSASAALLSPATTSRTSASSVRARDKPTRSPACAADSDRRRTSRTMPSASNAASFGEGEPGKAGGALLGDRFAAGGGWAREDDGFERGGAAEGLGVGNLVRLPGPFFRVFASSQSAPSGSISSRRSAGSRSAGSSGADGIAYPERIKREPNREPNARTASFGLSSRSGARAEVNPEIGESAHPWPPRPPGCREGLRGPPQ